MTVMTFRLIVLLTTLTLAALPGAAARADEADDTRYRQLVAAAKADPNGVNYAELRAAYAKSSFYKGNASDPSSFRIEKPTAEAAVAFVDENFAIIGAHTYLLPLFPRDTLAMHIQVAAGLVTALLKGGIRGLTPETAIKVLTVSEEYDLMGLLKVKPNGQALVERNGTPYDRLSVTKTAPDGAPFNFDLWFDLTDLFAANNAQRAKPARRP